MDDYFDELRKNAEAFVKWCELNGCPYKVHNRKGYYRKNGFTFEVNLMTWEEKAHEFEYFAMM